MANTNNSLGLSNPNGETFVDYKIDPVGANNAFGAGITSGFSVRPNDPAGMSVLVGGEQGVQDSALVKSASGIIYPVGNSTGDALEVEIDGAPSTNSRIDSIVLSVDTTATTSELNGSDLISVDVVKGTSSASPTAPSDSDIMSEIGAGRAFIVLANITVSAGMTVITAGEISKGDIAQVSSQNVDFATYSTEEQVVGTWYDGRAIYRKTFTDIRTNNGSSTVTYPHGISSIHRVIGISGFLLSTASNPYISQPIPNYINDDIFIGCRADSSSIYINNGTNNSVSNMPIIVHVEYIKTS